MPNIRRMLFAAGAADAVVGELYVCGSGAFGCLGTGNTSDLDEIVQLGSLTDWIDADMVGVQTLSQNLFAHAVKTDGTLWAWGRAADGQLGDGTTTDKSSPIQIGSLTTWYNVSAGERGTASVKTDGTIWNWGINNLGQLGQGDTTNRSSPVQIGSLTNWASASRSADSTVARKTDGTLWSWGSGANGQLGDGTSVNKSSPVQIGSLTTWASVASGTDHRAAIKTDGTLWVWGNNAYGQLGNGESGSTYSSPIQVGSLTDWSKVNAGKDHTIAIKTNGTLWTWGRNLYGQLGHGNTTNLSSPVQVGSLTDWDIANGFSGHTVALKTNGTLWAWGHGDSGQLGQDETGDDADRSSPVQVGSDTDWKALNNSYAGNSTLALK